MATNVQNFRIIADALTDYASIPIRTDPQLARIAGNIAASLGNDPDALTNEELAGLTLQAILKGLRTQSRRGAEVLKLAELRPQVDSAINDADTDL